MKSTVTMDLNRVVEQLARAERHNGRLRGELKSLRGRAAELERRATVSNRTAEAIRPPPAQP